MQKLTLLLTTTLSFLLLIPSQKSSFADNCSPSINAEKSSVECWLKNQKSSAPRGGVWKSFARKPLVSIASLYFSPQGAGNYTHTRLKFSEKQLESAHSTVWNWDKPQPLKLKTDVSLQQLAPVSSEELKERGLNSDESGYKGVTWMSDGFAKQAQAVKDHQQGTLKLNQYIWITPASQTQPFCRTCKGSLSNSNIPEIINLRLRLIQYLGLILKDSDKSHFVTPFPPLRCIEQDALKAPVGANEVAHPVHRHDNGVLVGRALFLVHRPLRFLVLDKVQIVGVEEVGAFVRGAEVRVIVEDNIGRLVLQRLETGLRHFGVGITLELLLTQFEKRIEVMRHDDQVGLVSATVQGQPKVVHVGLH